LLRRIAAEPDGIPLSILAREEPDAVRLNEYVTGMIRDGYLEKKRGVLRVTEKGLGLIAQWEG